MTEFLLAQTGQTGSSLGAGGVVGLFVAIPLAVIVGIIGLVFLTTRKSTDSRSYRSYRRVAPRTEPVLGRPSGIGPHEGPRLMVNGEPVPWPESTDDSERETDADDGTARDPGSG